MRFKGVIFFFRERSMFDTAKCEKTSDSTSTETKETVTVATVSTVGHWNETQ